MKMKVSFRVALISLVILCFGFSVFSINRKIIKVRKSFHRKMRKYRAGLRANTFAFYKAYRNTYEFPKELKDVPQASDELILDVKEIKIRNAFAPYNASIIEKDNGYCLFFRYDLVHQMFYNDIYRMLGYVELDENLNQTENEFVKIETNSNYSEDPRVIKFGQEHYLVYNDYFDSKPRNRGMHLGSFDIYTKQIKTITPMDLKLSRIEKNWVPFAFLGSKEQLCFEYQISNPRRILAVDNLDNPSYMVITQQKEMNYNLPWNVKKWGIPLGGTPARVVKGEYLAFFHSRFLDKKNGVWWYVMGAYTFEMTPPFRITKCSPHPILFEGIYNSEHKNTADPCKCVIYPGGYAIAEKNGRTILQLSCGENDSTVKVITLDEEELLASLVPVVSNS